jgi:hypothetical protein
MHYIFTLTFLIALALTPASAAPGNPRATMASGGSFGDRILVGFRGGMNFTLPMPVKRFTVIQNIDGTVNAQDRKDYSPFYRNLGYQYGFSVLYRINPAITISLEPTFSTYTLKYQTKSVWNDATDDANRIEITTDYTNKLRYFEIPVELRYEMGSGQVRPYLAAGFFYGVKTGAAATAESDAVQYVDDVPIDLENIHGAGDVSGNFISTRLVAFPGAGVFVEFSKVILYAEADYYFGLHNVVNESARFANQQAVGSSYDVPDNLKPDNLAIHVGILFRIGGAAGSGGSSSGRGKSAVACPVIKTKW